MTDPARWRPAKAWLRRAEPVHGRGQTPKNRAKRFDLLDLFDRADHRYDAALAHPSTPAELASAGRMFVAAYRGDHAGATPLGAAVAWVLMTNHPDRKMWAPFVDELINRYGAGFTAEAVVIGAGLTVVYEWPKVSLATRARDDVMNVFIAAPHRAVRLALTTLPTEEYERTASLLAGLRGQTIAGNLTLSYLCPTQQDWVRQDLTAVSEGVLADDDWVGFSLLSSVLTVVDAERVFELGRSRDDAILKIGHETDRVYSMCVNVGPGCEHLVGELFDGDLTADHKKRMAAILADFNTDAGQQQLISRLGEKYVEPALLDAMNREPARAARLLADATGVRASELLTDHLRLHPELTPDGGTPLGESGDVVSVPLILATPPWIDRVRYPKPVTADVPRSTRTATVVWERGERDEWLTVADEDREEFLYARPIPADLNRMYLSDLAYGDEASARSVLPHAPVPDFLYQAGRDIRRTVARFEADAADLALRVAMARPTTTVDALLPIDSSEVGEQMIEWLGAPSVRPVVYRWFERHIATAAADLVGATATATGTSRPRLCSLVNELGRRGHREVIQAAARQHGKEVATAIDAILDIDPLMQLPARMPEIPAWMDPAVLPPVRLVDGSPLPATAVRTIVTMLALSRTDDVYAGIDVVEKLVDRDDLAELAWAAFERWCSAGHPSGQGWALDALGIVGDDETVRRLTPLINAWPLQSGHRRAEKGLDVLGHIGTDTALSHLWRISQDVKYPALKRKANTRIRQIADRLDLSPADLADRTVPDLGLDANGSIVVEVGAVSYTVAVDEMLRLVVTDGQGQRHAHVPRPSSTDTVESHAAYKRFVDLRTDIKRLGPELVGRFEKAMLTGRTWTMQAARDRLVSHPLMWQIVGRLAWTTNEGRIFRFSEVLREPVDATGHALTIGDDVEVSVVHPTAIGDDLAPWQRVFDDAGIEQPFEQLRREVFHGDPAVVLSALEGMKVPTRQLLSLTKAGWVREEPQDKGAQIALLKLVDGRLLAQMMVFPGFNISQAILGPQQKIEHAAVESALSAIEASELQRDLVTLTPRPVEAADRDQFMHP